MVSTLCALCGRGGTGRDGSRRDSLLAKASPHPHEPVEGSEGGEDADGSQRDGDGHENSQPRVIWYRVAEGVAMTDESVRSLEDMTDQGKAWFQTRCCYWCRCHGWPRCVMWYGVLVV